MLPSVLLFGISVPADNLRGPLYMEQVLDALHTRNPRRRRVLLEIGRHGDEVMLYCRIHPSLEQTFLRQLKASYPDARIVRLPPGALATPAGYRRYRRRLTLWPVLGSIRSWQSFSDRDQRTLADPLAGILSMIDDDQLHVRVTLDLRPVRPRRHQRLLRHAARHPLLEEKLQRLLFGTWLHVRVSAPHAKRGHARKKLQDVAAAFGRFTGGHAQFMRCLIPRTFYLSTEELAGLWHPATAQIRNAMLATVGSRSIEPPPGLPSPRTDPEIAVLGTVARERRAVPFGIRPEERLRHLAIVGKTGMGKSTLLRNLITGDITAGRGVGLIDPHGDLAEAVADAVPKERTNSVIYFDAGDRSHSIAFNPLHCADATERPHVAAGVVSALKKLYGDSWGPRLEHILRNAVLALTERPDASLLSLARLLGDAGYRRQTVGTLRDPVVRAFWQNEFSRWKPQLQAEAVAPVMNKVGQFLSNPLLRGILGQPENRLPLRAVMDDGRALLVNLSKGRLGEDGSSLLGSLLVTQLQIAAMRRADTPVADRRPYYLYVDEFQNFATASFAVILSEARKYGLGLTIANQYLDQVDDQTRAAVFGNVGSMVTFQVGATDASLIAEQLGTDVTPGDLMALPHYTAYARLLLAGLPSRPFSMTTLPPRDTGADNRLPVVRRASRHRYARPVAELEKTVREVFA